MTKQEAADYLRVSVRTLDNYVAKNRLAVTYLPGKTRSVADIKREDLDRLKAELAMAEHQPTVDAPRMAAPPGPLPRDLALDRNAAKDAVERFELLAAIGESLKGTRGALPLDRKLALTIREAAQYSGYGEGRIKAAIDEGKLKASKDGPRGSWVIKRADLEAWVKKL